MAKTRTLPVECRDEAEVLAMQPYSVMVIRDTTIRGEPIFLAINPELDGCMAHGKTSEKAIENLREARTDYIQVCLLSNTPIPIPVALKEINTNPSGTATVSTYYSSPKTVSIENLITETAQPKTRDVITEYAFKVLSTSEA